MDQVGVGAAWIASVLAPYAVAPHPNFPERATRGASLLALVSDSRSSEIGTREQVEITAAEWLLVTSARDSQLVDSQEAAMLELWSIATDQTLSTGIRVAAACYASVAAGELERSLEAVEMLQRIDSTLTVGGSTPESDSFQLGRALLLQHSAMRAFDAGDYVGAARRARDVLKVLPAVDSSHFEVFEVSASLTWGAKTVQRDVTRFMQRHARALLAHVEAFRSDYWVDVVRARPTIADSRVRGAVVESGSKFIREQFDADFQSHRRSVVFGGTSVPSAAYRPLLLAELSAAFGVLLSAREQLGRLRLLELPEDVWNVGEALRLLRLSRSTSAFKSAVASVRAEGPTSALIGQARSVIARVERGGDCLDVDLVLLEHAADSLESEDCAAAITCAMSAREAQWTPWAAPDVTEEKMWMAVARLVVGLPDHRRIALETLATASSLAPTNQTTFRALAEVVQVLNWEKLDTEVKARWGAWRREVVRSVDNSALVDAVDTELLGAAVEPEPGTLEEAVKAIGALGRRNNEDIVRVAEYLVRLLDQEAADAAAGHSSFGGYNSIDVAVAFALESDFAPLWDAVARYLRHPAVGRSFKAPGVERLTRNMQGVPSNVRSTLSSDYEAIRASQERFSFAQSTTLEFAEAIRLGAALGVSDAAADLALVVGWTSAGKMQRLEAARTLPYLSPNAGDRAVLAMLYQLSHDRDAAVRGEASGAMARLLPLAGDFAPSVISRLRSVLASDGVRAALGAVHGLQWLARNEQEMLVPLRSDIEAVSRIARSRTVRLACVVVLRDLGALSDGT